MRALLTALLCLAGTVNAQETSQFYLKDWDVVCDNTLTCRAVGYSDQSVDFTELSLALKLTRHAGPEASVAAEIQVHSLLPEEIQNIDAPYDFVIDGSVVAQVALDLNKAPLPQTAVAKLIAALSRNSQISLERDGVVRRLSDAGSTAALLFMDDVQGRVGSKSALVRPGNANDPQVRASLPAPVVALGEIKSDLPANHGVVLGRSVDAALPMIRTDEGCNLVPVDAAAAAKEVWSEPLDDAHFLLIVPCWLAAYNAGTAVFLVNTNSPDAPQLITTSATFVKNGVIDEIHKGRGLGDCFGGRSYVWTGKTMALQADWTTGSCRGFLGGAWQLPRFVSTAH